MEPIKMAIFDLGNVVYKFSFDNAFQFWSIRSGKPFEDIKKSFQMDEMYASHEVNKISIGQYKEHVCDMLNVDLTLSDFIAGWNSIFMDEVEGIVPVLDNLRKSMALVALSNTNEIHCAHMQKKYWRLFRPFDKLYFSHEMQSRKPDVESFNKVLSDFHLNAPEVIFLDDVIENVRSAEKMGIKSVHVKSFECINRGIRKYCEDLITV